ncbi:hypothetical protein C7974DRAFT_187588 [Boeremia exigua]|uniref:uncharacterized protein n=1 Tax=Boeremia exigua TaxID=749465 RepID=UPI001E8DE38E|nr:uncharacterized protein C7974DRAFT_187588 [Boeremia exigua]KAH6629480.1 hypothetical protein C7974DRAFT_187588 [Boeremia exigua]
MSSVLSDSNDITNTPQEVINEFWDKLITKKPGKVTQVFPQSLYANLLPPPRKQGTVKGQNAAESYEAAAKECRVRVKRIIKECQSMNEKFTDPDFDITDQPTNCLEGLLQWYREPESPSSAQVVSPGRLGFALRTLIEAGVICQEAVPLHLKNTTDVLSGDLSDSQDDGPQSRHRIDWIFEDPKFEIDGYSSSDVVQGANGDCWFIAAVAMICSNPNLIQKVCVERDEECGVYGFVFYRDGEWTWTVVDDNLFLSKPDFDSQGDTYDPTGIKETKYKKNHQTGSEALYFASCAQENETWLPLLEKAYAKVHGDYDAISGGISGEAVEDLTGGVTSKILTDRVLSKERLWKELELVNQDFLFSASSPGLYGDDSDARRGLALNHAYSVIKVVEEDSEDGKTKHRLVLIRNPWGSRANAAMGEWTGPWSDGSKEWNPYWMEKLGHKFGDDGLFWMSYEDLLKRFDLLDRTRLFDHNWTIVQQWTSVPVGWVTGFLNTKFSVEIKTKGPTVFQLCQLDGRYFRGLEGKYDFDLHFILQEKDTESGDYIVRARSAWFGNRSISAEVELEPGIYEVLPKIGAKRNAESPDVHEVITTVAERNPQKLRQIGLNYDLANAKGLVQLTDEEQKLADKKKREATEMKKRAKDAADREKAEFEAWKKEEKEEYEIWKKEKKRLEDKIKLVKAESGTVGTGPAVPAENEEVKSAAPVVNADNAALKLDEETPANTAPETDLVNNTVGLKLDSVDTPSGDGKVEHTLDKDLRVQSRSPSRALSRGRRPAPHMYDASRSYYGDELQPEALPRARSPVDTKTKPWNAVCVLGLRVYSQDSGVSIKLVKPKNAEEGAILDVGGDTAAGATM